MPQQTYTLTGRVAAIGETRQVSDKFKTRELIIDTDDGEYSQLIKFEFNQDHAAKLDAIRIGATVTVSFNIRGRKSGDNYFNSLQGWKIQ